MSDQKLKVLIVGSGGREHTLLKACLKSPMVSEVLAAPGNGGMEADARCVPVNVEDAVAIATLAESEGVNFVIIGPEVPLCAGAVDALAEKDIPAYGPKADGAKLEGSKAFTKAFLQRHKVPTAASETFTSQQMDEALAYLEKVAYPIVVKASGLAAGKGVIIAEDKATAIQATRDMLDGSMFGPSGEEVVIEEFLQGEEASIMLMVSGTHYVALPASQDHKRVGEGDTGLNTGGMGAYAPAAVVTDALDAQIRREIIEPTLEGLKKDGIDYRGTLYIGVMVTASGPKVLEFNVRFGDPETQVLIPLLRTDPVKLMWDCSQGTLNPGEVEISSDYAIVVVLAAKGYPGSYAKGDVIRFPETLKENTQIIHAGTKRLGDGTIVSSGGRVLGITALGKTLKAAAEDAYAVCDQINWENKFLRRDIGWRQLTKESKA